MPPQTPTILFSGSAPLTVWAISRSTAGFKPSTCGASLGCPRSIASDPAAVPILIGLGVSELSLSLSAIPTVKAQIRTLRLEACRSLAESALAAESAEEVRALVAEFNSEPVTERAEA